MYDAYFSEEVVSKLPFEATSIATSSSNASLFIGSRQGHLLACQQATNVKQNFEYQLSKNFEKKSISELWVVDSHDLILCLSDSICSVHASVEPYKLIHTVTKYRSISSLAYKVKEIDHLLYVAIAEKRRIILVKWIVDSLEDVTNINFTPAIFPEVVQKVAWCGNSLVFALRTEYHFVRVFSEDDTTYTNDNDLGKSRLLFSLGSRTDSPIIVEIPSKIGLGRDNEIAFIDSDTGDISNLDPCRFSEPPSNICCDYPYLVAILSQNIIEIRSIRPSFLIQKFSMNKAIMLTSGCTGTVFISSEHRAWKINSRKHLHQNIKFLISDKHFDLALILSDANPSLVSLSQKMDIQRRMAQFYFGQKKFSECFNIHLEMNTDVLLVINFFPQLIPEKYLSPLSKVAPDDLQFFEAPEGSGTLTENERKAGILALSEHLAMRRINHEKPIRLHYLDRKEGANTNLLPTDMLKRYESILELIDTVLLKCYLMSNPQLVSSLLRIRYCSVLLSEAAADLHRFNRTTELITLYWRRRMFRKALELLKREVLSCDGTNTSGVERLATYLRLLNADHQQLLFEYSPLVLQSNMELGVMIFTRENIDDETEASYDELPAQIFPTSTTEFNKDSILDFLKKQCIPALVPYLEYLVYKSSDEKARKNPKFHQALLEEYIRRVRELMSEYMKVIVCDEEFHTLTTQEEKDDALNIYRQKLQKFLFLSNHYEPLIAFNLLFDDENLVEERTILYGRLGQHDEAIFIYTNILLDFESVEQHCQHYFDSINPATKNIFFILFEAYAATNKIVERISKPTNSSKTRLPKFLESALSKPRRQNISECLRLLRKHVDKLDTIAALALVPTDTPLSKVWASLEAVFEVLRNKSSSTSLMRSVTDLAVHKTRSKVASLRSQKVFVDYSVECGICRKRIGDSTFVSLCDGSLVHFFCHSRRSLPLSESDQS